MEIPRAGWTSTHDKVQWAESVSAFLAREKSNAEKCLRDCEKILNDPNVKSDSLKEGLRDLRSKTEDNFGTLLHLERVLDMKNLGDDPEAGIQIPQNKQDNVNVAASAPQFTQTGRFRQQRIRSIDFGNDFMEHNDHNDEAFDPLTDEPLYEDKESGPEDLDEDSGMNNYHLVFVLVYGDCHRFGDGNCHSFGDDISKVLEMTLPECWKCHYQWSQCSLKMTFPKLN